MSSRVRIGVIGYGYWGPKLVRNFYDMDEAEVACVCDTNLDRIEELYRHYPTIQGVRDAGELIHDTRVDALAVATPVSSHYELAREALMAGKHVLVEKPLARTSDQARELAELASARGLILMVGHTFLYHGAVVKIRDLVRQGVLGELLYIDSTRANLGILRDDINVVWDLAPHDLSIMDCLLEQTPHTVCATGASHTGRGIEDVAFLTFQYQGNLIGHVNVNWLSPVKVRTFLVGGAGKMVVYDDTEPIEKVKVYDRGLSRVDSPGTKHNELIRQWTGDVLVPKLDPTEALLGEVRDFIECIREKRKPVADADSALRVVRLLELACTSLQLGGRPVEVKEW